MKSNYFVIAFAMMVFVSVSCNRSKNVSLDCKDCGLDMPRFEEKYPQKTVEYDCLESEVYDRCEEDSGKKQTVTFSSIEEAEWKLLHSDMVCECALQEEVFYNLLKKIVKADTSSIVYPFTFLNEASDKDSDFDFVNIVSQDGRLHIYSIDYAIGPCCGYHNLVQYRWNGDVKTVEFGYDYDTGHASEIYGKYFEACDIRRGNDTYYLLSNYSYGIRDFTSGCEGYILTENGLKSVDLFKDSDGIHKCIFSVNEESYIVKERDGKVFRCEDLSDDTPVTIYLGANRIGNDGPEERKIYDRYYKYVWDGSYFVRQEGRIFANPFSCLQLYDYYSNEMLVETERNLIRIDLMKDKTYRYAAWKAGASMSETPELVIYNGRMDKSCYVFNNEGYEYKVGNDEVVVKKGKDVVGRWNY